MLKYECDNEEVSELNFIKQQIDALKDVYQIKELKEYLIKKDLAERTLWDKKEIKQCKIPTISELEERLNLLNEENELVVKLLLKLIERVEKLENPLTIIKVSEKPTNENLEEWQDIFENAKKDPNFKMFTNTNKEDNSLSLFKECPNCKWPNDLDPKLRKELSKSKEYELFDNFFSTGEEPLNEIDDKIIETLEALNDSIIPIIEQMKKDSEKRKIYDMNFLETKRNIYKIAKKNKLKKEEIKKSEKSDLELLTKLISI